MAQERLAEERAARVKAYRAQKHGIERMEREMRTRMQDDIQALRGRMAQVCLALLV
jgi:hypothetical protein